MQVCKHRKSLFNKAQFQCNLNIKIHAKEITALYLDQWSYRPHVTYHRWNSSKIKELGLIIHSAFIKFPKKIINAIQELSDILMLH